MPTRIDAYFFLHIITYKERLTNFIRRISMCSAQDWLEVTRAEGSTSPWFNEANPLFWTIPAWPGQDLLTDFAIFDPKHGSEMISLEALEDPDSLNHDFVAADCVSLFHM